MNLPMPAVLHGSLLPIITIHLKLFRMLKTNPNWGTMKSASYINNSIVVMFEVAIRNNIKFSITIAIFYNFGFT